MKNDYGERIPISKIILSVIGLTALIGVATIAPNALQILKVFGLPKKRFDRQKYHINTALNTLYKKGLIEIVEKADGKKYTKLSIKGKKMLVKFEIEGLLKHKPTKWDGKYRVVIFDIKEKSRFSRDDLRCMLSKFGFVRLQNSVWVYPYPCEGAISLLKSNLQLEEGDEVIYMTVDSIENDNWLKKKFNLLKPK